MEYPDRGHVSEDVVDDYARGSLAEPELTRVEEHLLICELCRTRVQAADDLISALRAASPEDCDDKAEKVERRDQPGDGAVCATAATM